MSFADHAPVACPLCGVMNDPPVGRCNACGGPLSPDAPPPDESRWYAGVTRYQWLVLAVASAGWVFDVFEGQIFNITRRQMLTEILGTDSSKGVDFWGDVLLGVFLLGGTFGGLMFGSLADRWGRRPTLMATILLYSIFSGLTGFATELWQVIVLRFLVAVGTGGEWAVAAALVSEVFPTRARAHASSVFHATSTFGTWLATIAGLWVASEWRYAYFVGVLPALLVLVVRARVQESDAWTSGRRSAEPQGSFRELLGSDPWRRRAIFGLLLAMIGLSTFWCVTIAGQDLARLAYLEEHQSNMADASDEARSAIEAAASQRAKFAYGIVQATGGGLGLLAFGPISAWLGRKKAFVFFQLAALAIVPVTCFVPATYSQMLAILPLYGFFTLAMHAGFAVYFPELFPTRLRATGASFCFNGGRLVAAPMLVLSGWIKDRPDVDLRVAIALLSSLFLLGILFVLMLPETKGRPLPE